MLCEELSGQDVVEKACSAIAEELNGRSEWTRDEVWQLRKRVCKEFGLKCLPSNLQIYLRLKADSRERLQDLLRIKPVRTASGIAVVAVMSRPYPCPYGVCMYCPGGLTQGTPQSYTGTEPAAMRGAQYNYDSYSQVRARIEQLSSAGHKVDKVELIILGGTFLSFPIDYQTEFVKGCYDGLNGSKASTLEEAKSHAEKARVRNVGFTVETRPDFCKAKHVDLMLSYGVTRVEIGVQSLRDEVYRIVNRGHSVKDVIEAFQTARDSGYKIVAHMMLGLPGSTPEGDLEDFHILFKDPCFKPDMIKIYPTLVLPNTGLYRLYESGGYRAYDLETVVDVLAEVKRIIPTWIRIMRIQREIPSQSIVAGVSKSNLRELVLQEVSRRGYSCKCIRCREIGLKQIKAEGRLRLDRVELVKHVCEAAYGLEVFLSYEDALHDALVGFLRLRLPSEEAHRPEVSAGRCALVRELHIYGPLVPLGSRLEEAWQHKGYGRRLMNEAEKIAAEEFGVRRILVISAIGTREYYRSLGYRLEGPYMVKNLS